MSIRKIWHIASARRKQEEQARWELLRKTKEDYAWGIFVAMKAAGIIVDDNSEVDGIRYGAIKHKY